MHSKAPSATMLPYFRRRNPLYIFLSIQIILFCIVLFYFDLKNSGFSDSQKNFAYQSRFSYNYKMPLIFIGGMPRSGTTLMRVLLDAHPDIRCGKETRLIPNILFSRHVLLKNSSEMRRLEEAGITESVLDSAIRAFILEIIVHHGRLAPRLCNKDPLILRRAVYLQKIFPNSKFIFMIRDGRAVVHSLISRNVTVSGFNLTSYKQSLEMWNKTIAAMHKQCTALGVYVCLPVYYEQLVLHPKVWIEKILHFLNVPWSSNVLHHDQLIEMGNISLSKLERSTDQVIKPINIEALTKWVGHIPQDVVENMGQIAPMLRLLGYNPDDNSPSYGQPDDFVRKNMKELARNRHNWNIKTKVIIEEQRKLKRMLEASTTVHSTEII